MKYRAAQGFRSWDIFARDNNRDLPRDFARRFFAIFLAFVNPHASIVPQRFGHQRKLGLMFAADRNARGMNLREGWVGKKSSPFVSAISGRDIAAARIG